MKGINQGGCNIEKAIRLLQNLKDNVKVYLLHFVLMSGKNHYESVLYESHNRTLESKCFIAPFWLKTLPFV